MSDGNLPRWSLESVYPGFDSPEFTAAKKELARLADELLAHLASVPSGGVQPDCVRFLPWLAMALDIQNRSQSLSLTLSSYCYAAYSVDTIGGQAMNELNAVEEIALPFTKAYTIFLNVLSANADLVRSCALCDPAFEPYRFFLDDALFWQTRQMSTAEEDLAADLSRSGADAWGRLQEQMTSTASCLWDETAGERKTLVQLRSLAHATDRAVRAKAFKKELEVCASIGLPVAAALNGVKGCSVALNARRKWEGGALEKAVRQGQLTQKSLDALIGAMEESLPAWRRYLKAKARLLGQKSCAFYDLFAPVGNNTRVYSYAEARALVTENFARFSPAMGTYAEKAFTNGWIDAAPRAGKIGGAYFTDMPLPKEGRVLCNFDGSFSSVLTLAHELGHAYHAEVLKDEPALLQTVPMTLAETASIFAETIVFEAEMAKTDPDEKLGLVEMHLQDGCQILVDILSRYYFENALFAARKKGELSADELCALMADAQKRTYGDGLDPDLLHPYMWLVKTHYYSSDLAFYNFPYAFGQLFALALFERSRTEGAAFADTYASVLRDTGAMDAVRVTARAGFDIEATEFWRSGIGVFTRQIEEFEKLVDATAGQHHEEFSK